MGAGKFLKKESLYLDQALLQAMTFCCQFHGEVHGQWGPRRPASSAWTPSLGSFMKPAEGKIPQNRATPLRNAELRWSCLTLNLLTFQFLGEKDQTITVLSCFSISSPPNAAAHVEEKHVPGLQTQGGSGALACFHKHLYHLPLMSTETCQCPHSSPASKERSPGAPQAETLRLHEVIWSAQVHRQGLRQRQSEAWSMASFTGRNTCFRERWMELKYPQCQEFRQSKHQDCKWALLQKH